MCSLRMDAEASPRMIGWRDVGLAPLGRLGGYGQGVQSHRQLLARDDLGLARCRTIHSVVQGLAFVFDGDFMVAILTHDDARVA